MLDWDFKKGSIETYYEIAAYNKPKMLFTTIKQLKTYNEAKNFCKEYNYEYECLYHDQVYKCKLIIIKVISEIL